MKHRIVLTLILWVVSGGGLVRAQDDASATPAQHPQNMKPYFIVFLTKGEKFVKFEESDPVVRNHMAYIRKETEAGKIVIAGPFLDGGNILGMAVVTAGSAEEAKSIIDADPYVQSGRGASEVHPAYLPDLSAVKVEYSTK